MAKYELLENDVQLIGQLCDIALKAGGVQNYNAVGRILEVIKKPVKEEKAKKSNPKAEAKK